MVEDQFLFARSIFAFLAGNKPCVLIGIAGHEMPEWSEISCFTEEIPIEKEKDRVVLQIPERFSRFYSIDRKHKVVSVNGNNILVTISGRIVEEKKYPS